MINFFRKVRKQLANDNKSLKYMRLAIGEIVLIDADNFVHRAMIPIVEIKLDNKYMFSLTALRDVNNIFTHVKLLNTRNAIEETIQMIEHELEK